jgi:dATP pyrophosphohydrolase
MNYYEAMAALKWDGNKVALWELNKRFMKKINTEEFIKERGVF